MSPGSSTESYPAFPHLGLRENPGKNLNQVTCPDRKSNPGHLVSRPDALTVTPQSEFSARAAAADHSFIEQPLDGAYIASDSHNISCNMAAYTEIWSSVEMRHVIQCLRLKITSPAQIHCQLVEIYGAKQSFQWEVLDHPPYSLNLAPSNFHHFQPLKKHLGGKRVNTDTAVQQRFMTWLQELDADFLYVGIYALVYRWNNVLTSMVTMLKSNAYQCPTTVYQYISL
ncbi:hypothetical protein ANN_21692 [Periplaneta americana]|uniref:Uncharacterized protein n=1 Tax=Periplaneta americana TaxID=6978 RepID=A0ABQ8S658_PERAM|nr:hypothetical protein ANN_21692 [Periplaneta americana]